MKELLDAYERELETLRRMVFHRQWADLEVQVSALEKVKGQLQEALQAQGMDDETRLGLEQLSIKHRRIMRQLSEHMRQTQEDLEQVDAGLRHIHQVQSLPMLLAS